MRTLGSKLISTTELLIPESVIETTFTLEDTDFSEFINVYGFITFRVFGFAGVYTEEYSDSQPFTHIDKSDEIRGETVTNSLLVCSS